MLQILHIICYIIRGVMFITNPGPQENWYVIIIMDGGMDFTCSSIENLVGFNMIFRWLILFVDMLSAIVHVLHPDHCLATSLPLEIWPGSVYPRGITSYNIGVIIWCFSLLYIPPYIISLYGINSPPPIFPPASTTPLCIGLNIPILFPFFSADSWR